MAALTLHPADHWIRRLRHNQPNRHIPNDLHHHCSRGRGEDRYQWNHDHRFSNFGRFTMKQAIPLATQLFVSLFIVSVVGCTPRVIVTPNPGPTDTGVRYYRPKPYLKVEPAEVAIDRNAKKFAPGIVRLSLVYLPDFSEEYSIDVRTGFGTADVGIELEDGWNLTAINQDLDSQTDENIEAIGKLIGAVGDVVPTSLAPMDEDISFTVPATDVPIGFYEAVLGRDSCGRKRLYGFRYVGFVPYGQCPLEMGGSDFACCHDPTAGLFGLTFRNGKMVFKPLAAMSVEPDAGAAGQLGGQTEVAASSGVQPGLDASWPSPLDFTVAQQLDWEADLLSHLREIHPGVESIHIRSKSGAQAGSHVIDVKILPGVNDFAVRMSAEQWIGRQAPALAEADLRIVGGSDLNASP